MIPFVMTSGRPWPILYDMPNRTILNAFETRNGRLYPRRSLDELTRHSTIRVVPRPIDVWPDCSEVS